VSTAALITQRDSATSRLSLQNGDRMSQPEFHRRYQAYLDDVKFELVEGTVYLAAPLHRQHALYHSHLNALLFIYKSKRPGVEVLDYPTTILGPESEPQPDLVLRVLLSHGGRSRETPDQYIHGPPELIVEIAHSTRSIDMYQKRREYVHSGVREYLVLCVEEAAFHGFRFKPHGKLAADEHGVLRSNVFPGLWIDCTAVLADNHATAARTLRNGIASPEHAAFVRRLRAHNTS
jgi:Uma2 family endonuclease